MSRIGVCNVSRFWIASGTNMFKSSKQLSLILSFCFCMALAVGASAEERADSRQVEEADTGVGYWVTQLGSDSYLRRQNASRRLIESGPKAVPFVVAKVNQGDLETTRRSIDVLQQIAFARQPEDDGGAWAALQELATYGVGSRASRAASAVADIVAHRGQIARESLESDGVFIGTAHHLVNSAYMPIIELDESWSGNLENLRWLRWLDGVQGARIKGEAIRADVMQYIIEMPDLTSIALLDGEIGDPVFDVLDKAGRLRDLEFRYVPLEAEMSERLVQLPVQSKINLMGTGIPEAVVDEMRMARPRLQFDFRQGGFLGVSCNTELRNNCIIDHVFQGSGADKAGLMRGDLITSVDDAEVARFEDLQEQINRHMPGDTLKIRFNRQGVVAETSATLGRLDERIQRLR